MTKYNKLIRIVTVAPIMALVTLTLIRFLRPDLLASTGQYLWAVGCLCLLPLLAYPLQPLIPHYKDRGRQGQRSLAIVMSVVGYIGGIAIAFVTRANQFVWTIYLTYFMSGIGIVLFNKVIKLNASGHACGIAGPIALLFCCFGAVALWGAVVFIAALLASIAMGRHTVWQFFGGAAISVASLMISIVLLNNFYPLLLI